MNKTKATFEYVLKRVSLGSKDCTKELKLEIFKLKTVQEIFKLFKRFLNLKLMNISCTDPEGGGGGGGQGVRIPHPLKNHKNIEFPSNTGPDPLKNHNATKPAASMFSHHRPASETPFKCRFTGGPMIVHFKWYLDPLSPLIN